MTTILFLGGAFHQIPPIMYARDKGYRTVLCDYLPDNPGQRFADVYYPASTTDKDAVLAIARKERIDGIIAYATDPAAPTAAYVGNRLGLPSNPYESVETMSRKDLFRRHLAMHGFNCPESRTCVDAGQALIAVRDIGFPAMVKPVDSSGSKGVSIVRENDDISQAFGKALSFSRCGTVIVEEYVERYHDAMIGGDGFVVDGKLSFCGFLDSHRSRKHNPFIPIGTSYPLTLPEKERETATVELQRLITSLNLVSGPINIEIMISREGKLYFLELGPRNGGNMIPEFLGDIYGIDLIGASVDTAFGRCRLPAIVDPPDAYYSNYVLKTESCGWLKGVCMSEEAKRCLYKTVMYRKEGERVEAFSGANNAIGMLFFRSTSLKDQLSLINSFEDGIIALTEE